MTKFIDKNIVTGVEYNYSSGSLDSVYELTLYGKRKLYTESNGVKDFSDSFTHHIFKDPFSLLCENTPNRITFLTTPLPTQTKPDWIVNKNIITLVGFSRVYDTIVELQRYGTINWVPRIDYTLDFKGTLEPVTRVENNNIKYYAIKKDSLTYMEPLPSGFNFDNVVMIFYPFIFKPTYVRDGGDLSLYSYMNTECAFLERFYNVRLNAQSGGTIEVPLLSMVNNNCVPNITLSYFNVML